MRLLLVQCTCIYVFIITPTYFTQHKKYELQSLNMHGYPTKTNVIKDVMHLFLESITRRKIKTFTISLIAAGTKWGGCHITSRRCKQNLIQFYFRLTLSYPSAAKAFTVFLSYSACSWKIDENYGEDCYKGLPCCLSDVWFTTYRI